MMDTVVVQADPDLIMHNERLLRKAKEFWSVITDEDVQRVKSIFRMVFGLAADQPIVGEMFTDSLVLHAPNDKHTLYTLIVTDEAIRWQKARIPDGTPDDVEFDEPPTFADYIQRVSAASRPDP